MQQRELSVNAHNKKRSASRASKRLKSSDYIVKSLLNSIARKRKKPFYVAMSKKSLKKSSIKTEIIHGTAV